MTDITIHSNNLPVKLEDLAKFVLVGREKLTAVRALIKAMDRIEMAAGVREQKIEEAQMLAEALLDAEARVGELSQEIPKAYGTRNQYAKVKNDTAVDFQKTKSESIKELGFNQKQIERFQTLAANKDIIEEAKAEARANDDIVNRSMVLKAIKEKEQVKNRFNEAIIKANENDVIETVQQGNDLLAKVKEVKHGDIYMINGKHKLIVGDCSDVQEVLKITGKVDAIITDPPYGIGYKSPTGSGKTKRGDYNVINNDDKEFDPEILFKYSANIVTWGANHYAHKLPPSAGWLVWDKRDGDAINNNSDCELAWSNMLKSARLFHHKWNGMIKASEKQEQRLHPTQKPVKLFIWCYEVTESKQYIIDPFGGSGTSLIACEQTGRTCYLVENDISFAAAAIQRFQDSKYIIEKL